ncbi:TetR/AcrR family transcriptional regulator [Sulfuricystis multivorans]|uniref:TetR/AcrR family transcriptional regulator n=1 Tax=Sulfuricystis multivorans TaxID=2211108 RepID=UPI000F846203|nr:TetR/AcrR family transcriptional regulator [Sulfuricystis multivorans]
MSFPDQAASGDCRKRLLQAACEVFGAEGYHVSVDRIAAQAGVAKQTLYNHFSSKAELFAEVIKNATAEFLVALDDDGTPLRERLVRFGVRYRERLLSTGGLQFYRMLVAEIPRFPELAAAFYESGPRRTAACLREVIKASMACGELRCDDAEFAAGMLLSMLVGAERSQYLFSGETPPEFDPGQAARIVDCFLRAFAPEGDVRRSDS